MDKLVWKILSVFFVSMLPIVELRGGIPLGTGLGLPMWICYPVCIIGNLIPVPFILFFAKSFLEKYNDIALLADLMGHENIETTRIYLRKTSTEQQAIVDKYVDW